MATPTLIGMPEPPSNPDTPTEMPGTPNSTTTSLSALSTTAIKDGHRGSSHPLSAGGFYHHTPSSNTLEAERADRISRLAGLERVSAARPSNIQGQAGAAGTAGPGPGGQIPGYFDHNGNPVYTTKMSTVGSASATGSTGGQTTTWASGSIKGQTDAGDEEVDGMSIDASSRDIDEHERDRYSASASAVDEDGDVDAMSDDTSLVGFGEGAGSTLSGPTYNRRELATNNSAVGKSGLSSFVQAGMSAGPADQRGGVSGVEAAARIVRDRPDDGEEKKLLPLANPDEAVVGKLYFEDKK